MNTIEITRISKLKKELSIEHDNLRSVFEYNLPLIQSADKLESFSATMAVAGFVQGIYTKAEEVFKFIAKSIDSSVPKGDGWRRELLDQMALETNDRTPVIGEETFALLKKSLQYRNVVRSNCASDLKSDKAIQNAEICIKAMDMLVVDLERFSHRNGGE